MRRPSTSRQDSHHPTLGVLYAGLSDDVLKASYKDFFGAVSVKQLSTPAIFLSDCVPLTEHVEIRSYTWRVPLLV